MAKGWTTMAVRKNTHKMIKENADASGISQDKYLNSLMVSGTTPNINAYVYSPDEYNTLIEMAKFLFETKNIDKPDVDSATRFAISNLREGVAKSIQK